MALPVQSPASSKRIKITISIIAFKKFFHGFYLKKYIYKRMQEALSAQTISIMR